VKLKAVQAIGAHTAESTDPDLWLVKVDMWQGPTIANCFADGEKWARLFAATPTMVDLLRSAAKELQDDHEARFGEMATTDSPLAMEINKLLQEIER
jgi:hypothetical protein